eukprot:7192684-Karenia_brevis.AAC.1
MEQAAMEVEDKLSGLVAENAKCKQLHDEKIESLVKLKQMALQAGRMAQFQEFDYALQVLLLVNDAPLNEVH